jgi:signal transduction histidine kinase
VARPPLPAWLTRRLPRSVRSQFTAVLLAMVASIGAGSLVAVLALRWSAAAAAGLAGERLERMREAQELVQRTMLVERRSVSMLAAASPEELRRSTAATVAELDLLDGLVDRLGAASAGVEVLALHQSAELFRNGVHVLEAVRVEALRAGAAFTRQEALGRARAEVEREAVGMVAAAQQLSARLDDDHREAITRLAGRARAIERWGLAVVAGGLVLSWLAFRTLLARQVLGRLAVVSGYLRRGEPGEGPTCVPVRGGDEIAEMARAVEQFLTDRQRLAEANAELEGLSYSVSHNLRAPLRHVDGFTVLLRQRLDAVLDAQGRHYLEAISEAGRRMEAQIEGLIAFLRMRRAELAPARVDTGALAREVVAELAREAEGRPVEWTVGALPPVEADPAVLRLVLVALLSNALKFTTSRAPARIEVGSAPPDAGGRAVVFVRDNGVGFDMRHADKLFVVFHRLHHEEDFAGTGVGLAVVRRAVERQGGRAWAEGAPGQGATFYLALPDGTRPGLTG